MPPKMIRKKTGATSANSTALTPRRFELSLFRNLPDRGCLGRGENGLMQLGSGKWGLDDLRRAWIIQ
jgi:hypothetical protein